MAAAGGVAAWGGARGADAAEANLIPAAAALLFLNLLDGLFTLVFLQLGLAEEANPLMRAAYEHSPVAFMLLKLAVVHAGVLLLTTGARIEAARQALWGGALLYGAIVLYHLAYVLRLTTA